MVNSVCKTECTGCTACVDSCPNHCIRMEKDEEGFYYPTVDLERCVNCNICQKVCPSKLKKNQYRSEKVRSYACQNVNEYVRKISTSGGAFGAIADYVLSDGGIVWGAAFNDDAIVVHKKVDNSSELKELFGSKYVQSQLDKVFLSIKQELKNGNKPVLFIGTPCQVEGLYYMLSDIDIKNLITIDLICYGVPSPGLYEKWITSLSTKYDSKVESISFRDKKYGYAGVNVKVYLKNGKMIEDCSDAKSFGKTMFSHIGLRPSCYECQFRGRKKLSDFTLGDFWEIGEYSKTMDDDKGTSILKVNSDKGQQIFDSIKNKYFKYLLISELEGEALEKEIEAGAYSVAIPEKRDSFFRESETMEYEKLIEIYLPVTWKETLANVLKPIIVKTPFSRYFFKKMKKWKMHRGK